MLLHPNSFLSICWIDFTIWIRQPASNQLFFSSRLLKKRNLKVICFYGVDFTLRIRVFIMQPASSHLLQKKPNYYEFQQNSTLRIRKCNCLCILRYLREILSKFLLHFKYLWEIWSQFLNLWNLYKLKNHSTTPIYNTK